VAGASNAVPTVAEAPAAPAPEPEPAVAPAEGDVHPVVAIVRGMYQDAYAVKGAAVLAERLLAEIELQAKSAESFTNITRQAAEDMAKLNNALVERVNSLGFERSIAEAPRKVAQLKRTLDSVKTDVASLIALKAAETVETEKRKKAEAVAEKKRQEQEAYQQKIANEKATVSEAESSNAEALKLLQFREVTRALKDVKDGLETPEAQELASIAIERVNRLKDFHEYLIKRAPGFKSRYGWSVDGADAKSLSVGGKKVPWTEAFTNPKIIAELVQGLVSDEQATKDLRLREKTRMMTNAAICLNLFHKELEAFQKKAKELANDAATQFDLDADNIKQLLPEFF
jgi:hypothetical protein